ncbi:MAG: hypothetical protein JWO91_1724 [Acidobacteriaceae bacterium]|nr:hypothetical protein [Acidobacteriaceae bacterium]
MLIRRMQLIWKPLEEKLGKRRCVGFMYMGRMNGVNLYKHGMSRTYLNLDDLGQCYVWTGNSHYERVDFATELAKLEAALARIGETLESVYDEAYMAKKDAALKKAGFSVTRLEVKPETMSVN